MSDAVLNAMRDVIQHDIGNRGLQADPVANLVNAWPEDFRLACESIAHHPRPSLAVVTGFFIPTANPPAGETDGPLGALFLARALQPMGIRVILATDNFCISALAAGLAECGLTTTVPLVNLPTHAQSQAMSADDYADRFAEAIGGEAITHRIAIERVGPNRDGRCLTMRGRDITDRMSPADRLFVHRQKETVTIGIGDGGNEIGMGKIASEIIGRNIPNGGAIACRTATDFLIVAGVSNWGGYALAAGVAHLRRSPLDAQIFDPERERKILAHMVEAGPLVDGVTGRQSATIDGLTWEQYADILEKLRSAAKLADDEKNRVSQF